MRITLPSYPRGFVRSPCLSSRSLTHSLAAQVVLLPPGQTRDKRKLFPCPRAGCRSTRAAREDHAHPSHRHHRSSAGRRPGGSPKPIHTRGTSLWPGSYKPSDAAVLRSYGSALLAQTPLLQLRELDPYKPSHAELLRQLGGAMPLWSHLSWYPMAPPLAPLMEVPAPAVAAAGKPQSPSVVVIVVQPERFVAPPSPRQQPRRVSGEQWVLSGTAQNGVVWTRSPQSVGDEHDGSDESAGRHETLHTEPPHRLSERTDPFLNPAAVR